jgi:hypothetical protein
MGRIVMRMAASLVTSLYKPGKPRRRAWKI